MSKESYQESVSGLIGSIKRAASPLIERIRNVLSPIQTHSAPASPIMSPTKSRPRAARTISSSLREKNKTLVIGKPLDKVYKVSSAIGKKRQPKMNYIKQLKEPKSTIKKSRNNYLDEALVACKKEGKLMEIPKRSPLLKKPVDFDKMQLDTVPILSTMNTRPLRSTRKQFKPPNQDDPDFVSQFPFDSEIDGRHYGSIPEIVNGIQTFTNSHRPSEKFVFQ